MFNRTSARFHALYVAYLKQVQSQHPTNPHLQHAAAKLIGQANRQYAELVDDQHNKERS